MRSLPISLALCAAAALPAAAQWIPQSSGTTAEFRGLVDKSKMKIDEGDWQKDLPFIRAMIRFEIDLDLFGVEAARKDLTKSDPQLQFALGLFPEAQRLLDLSKAQPTATRVSR